MSESHGAVFEIGSDVRDDDTRDALWDICEQRAMECTACPLCEERQTVVFGEGNRKSRVLLIGEAPGADEDEQGRPFVGRAGQLLTKVLASAGIERESVYITNTVKCRPPKNRDPQPDEMTACDVYLQSQILLIDPAIIVTLGNIPTKWLLKTSEGIVKMRGRWVDWKGISVMPMFHPSYLLRNPVFKVGSPKHDAWLDIQEVKRKWDEILSNSQDNRSE